MSYEVNKIATQRNSKQQNNNRLTEDTALHLIKIIKAAQRPLKYQQAI